MPTVVLYEISWYLVSVCAMFLGAWSVVVVLLLRAADTHSRSAVSAAVDAPHQTQLVATTDDGLLLFEA